MDLPLEFWGVGLDFCDFFRDIIFQGYGCSVSDLVLVF